MKRATNQIQILLISLTLVSCFSDPVADERDTSFNETLTTYELSEMEINILELINEHRINIGLSTLEINNEIKTQTQNHTNYMISKNEISHDFFHSRKEYLTNK